MCYVFPRRVEDEYIHCPNLKQFNENSSITDVSLLAVIFPLPARLQWGKGGGEEKEDKGKMTMFSPEILN